jgi:CRP-like cAMP-binding protein
MHLVNLLAYAASAAVLATFCMSTMIPLRIIGLVSNVLFMAYGYVGQLYPVLLLHAICMRSFCRCMRRAWDNSIGWCARCAECRAGTSRSKASRRIWRIENLARPKCSCGKGERADRLYYLVDGEIEVVEFGKVLHPGTTVGEIGVFSPSHQRTATIVCRTDCNMLELTESKAKQLYFQDRSFSFAVMQLIISRLAEDSERLIKAGTADLADFDIGVNKGRAP